LTNLDDKGIPFTVRTVFVIDPAKRVRLSLQYPVRLVSQLLDEPTRRRDRETAR